MTLDRYLLKEFLKFSSFLSGFFILMFCVIDFLEKNTRYFPKYNAKGMVIVEYYLTQIPKILVDLLPFSVMFSAVVVLWMFAKSGEIAAMRAAGRSIFRICLPLLLAGLMYTILSFLLNEFLVPRAMLHLKKVETVKIEKSALGEMFFESNWIRGSNSILHFRKINQGAQSLEGVEYYEFAKPSVLAAVTHAQRASFSSELKVWQLENSRVSYFSANGEFQRFEFQQARSTNVSSRPPRLLGEGVTSDQISYQELRELILDSQKAGGALAAREVDLYQKLSIPFANLIFVFFALPFALKHERNADTYIGIMYCLIAAIVYWVGNLSMRSLAQNGLFPPLIAAWAVPALLGVFCFWLVRKLDRAI